MAVSTRSRSRAIRHIQSPLRSDVTGPPLPRARRLPARTGRRSRHTDRGKKSTRGQEGAGRGIEARACSPRRPRNSARTAAARQPGTSCAAWAQPLDRGAAGRCDPDAWGRRGRGPASCLVAQRRIARAGGRILQGCRDLSGIIRASRPALLLLELARLPVQFLLLFCLAIVRSGHEVSSVTVRGENAFGSIRALPRKRRLSETSIPADTTVLPIGLHRLTFANPPSR